MSSLALMSGAESLKAQIVSLADNGEWYKAFLVSHALSKIADWLKKEYQPLAVEYWNTNKELPAGYSMKESSSGKKYAYEQDATWQLLKAHLEAREALLKKSADSSADLFDENGAIVPKVTWSEGVKYTFSQK